MTAYVLDASVAAKWFLPGPEEPLASEAMQVLAGYARGEVRLIVPDLFWAEFGNIIWKAVRQRRISRSSAQDAITELCARNFPTTPCQPLLPDAFAIASACDRSVYDGIYVALAVASATPLLTADERLANAMAVRFPIRWLGAV